jgi:hypothetical protein
VSAVGHFYELGYADILLLAFERLVCDGPRNGVVVSPEMSLCPRVEVGCRGPKERHTRCWNSERFVEFLRLVLADGVGEFSKACTYDDPGALGAAFYIPTAVVPPLLVTHFLILSAYISTDNLDCRSKQTLACALARPTVRGMFGTSYDYKDPCSRGGLAC